MKRIKILLIGILTFVSYMGLVSAAPGSSISVSNSSIEVGNSVKATVKVTGVAAWNIKINSSGNTSGCSQQFVGDSGTGQNVTQTFTVTCKSTSIGVINFDYSGDITAAGSGGNNTTVKVSGSKRVTVTAVRPKSTNSDLKSLSVEGYELSPVFDKDTLEYSLTVDATVTRINVIAEKADSYSKVSNTGVLDVTEGENKIDVIVTAENGAEKTYTINVTVKELNPIIVNINNKDYTVVKKSDNLNKPDTYEPTTVIINETEIPAFYSDITKFTLVGLKDQEGNISLFIYDEGNGSYTRYNEITFLGIIFYPMDTKDIPKGYEKCSITIGDEEVVCYHKNKDDKFVLVYGLNVSTGEVNWYLYDKTENTIQRFNKDYFNSLEKKANTYLITTCIFGGSFVLLLLLFIVTINKRKNKKKKTKYDTSKVESQG